MATTISNPFLSFRGQLSSTSGWFSMPYPKYDTMIVNNGGGGFMGSIGNDVYFIPNGATSSYNPCSNSSYRTIVNSSNYQNYLNVIGVVVNQDIPDLPNSTDNFILVFPTELVGSYRYVKVNKPEFKPADSTCSTLTYISAFPVYEYEQAESGSGGSTDITPLIPAILMIPATIIVICFFSVIYKMFMNKKVRG